jgi:hypothetical protein
MLAVKEARTTIAKEVGVDAEQYGLFLPPKEEQAGKWCRDDYPLSFYGLEGERESKEAHLMTNSGTVVCIAWGICEVEYSCDGVMGLGRIYYT